MNKYTIYWICQIIGWGVYAFVQIFLYYTANNYYDPDQTVVEIYQAIFNILLTHLYRLVIIKWGLLKLSWPKLIPTMAFLFVLLEVINTSSFLAFLFFKNNETLETKDIILNISQDSLFLFLWSSIYFTYHYLEKYNKSLQYEAAINEFEINNLKAQMNPHFIFNALNSIRALVDENPNKSKTAITRLSNILRSSLILDKKRLISFNDELTTVKDYLELESIRYEERLQFFFNIAPETFDFNVPPMMIQTIVENGIKHGVSNLTNGGHISLKTQVINHTLLIQVRNSGQYNSNKNDTNSGFGLNNTIKRLHLIYGEEASFTIKNESEDTVLTEIVIPETI